MATDGEAAEHNSYENLCSRQKEKLNTVFEELVPKITVDYSDTEIQDIQRAVVKLLEGGVDRIKERGIFNISHIQPCGSMAENMAVWRTKRKLGDLWFLGDFFYEGSLLDIGGINGESKRNPRERYIEFDFLAVLDDFNNTCLEQGCAECFQLHDLPVNLEQLKMHNERIYNDEQNRLHSPFIADAVFSEEVSSNFCCKTGRDTLKRAGLLDYITLPPSAGVDHVCDKCTVDTPSGKLQVDIAAMEQFVNSAPKDCSLICHWTSKSRSLSTQSDGMFSPETHLMKTEAQVNTACLPMNTEPQPITTEPQEKIIKHRQINSDIHLMKTEPQTMKNKPWSVGSKQHTNYTETHSMKNNLWLVNSESQTMTVEAQTVNKEPRPLRSEPQTMTIEAQTMNRESRLNTISQTIKANPQTMNTMTQTIKADPQRMNTDRQTMNTMTQAIKADPQTMNTITQTIKADPQTMNTITQTIKADPLKMNTITQTIKADHQTMNTITQTIKADHQTMNTDPQTMNIMTQTIKADPQTMNTITQTIKADPRTMNTITQTVKADPQTMNTITQAIKADPQTMNTITQTIKADPQTMNTITQTIKADSQTMNTITQAIKADPQTMNTITQTIKTDPQTMNTITQTIKADPQTMNTEPQTMNTMTQTIKADPQTMNFETQPINHLTVFIDFLLALKISKSETTGSAVGKPGSSGLESTSTSNEKQPDCFIVPKGCSYCSTRNGWRRSGCIAEMETVRKMSSKHRNCYQIMKFLIELINSKIKKQNLEDSVPWYHVKTLLLHHSDSCKDSSEGCAACVLKIFYALQNAYKSKSLKSFHSQANLLQTNREHDYKRLASGVSKCIPLLCNVTEDDSCEAYLEMFTKHLHEHIRF